MGVLNQTMVAGNLIDSARDPPRQGWRKLRQRFTKMMRAFISIPIISED